jgi:4-amino-4-deoxy-L-arabinose transferase-like glycosyltransferase
MPGKKKILTFIFLLAIAVRIVFVISFGRPPYKDNRWNDSVGWNLAQGHGFTASPGPPYTPGLYRTPAHPALLAVTYSVFGHSYRAAYVAQGVVDSFTALLVFGIGARLFWNAVGVAAGILYALYPYAAIFCSIMTQDILLTFAVTATLYLLIRALERPSEVLRWVAVGAMLGLTALVKPFLALFSVVIALAVLAAKLPWRIRIRSLAVAAVVSILVILPWGIRNYVVFHAFPPLAAGGTGSNMNALIEEIEKGDAAMMAKEQAQYGTPADEALRNFTDGTALIERERELARSAAPRLRQLRRQHAMLALRHIPRLWITMIAMWNRPIVGILGMVVSILLLLFGLIGMWMARARWRELMPLFATIVLVTLIYAPITVEARYTLPARPAMIVFAALALSTALRLISRQPVAIRART